MTAIKLTRKADRKANRRRAITLSNDAHAKLKELAKREAATMSDVVINLIERAHAGEITFS